MLIIMPLFITFGEVSPPQRDISEYSIQLVLIIMCIISILISIGFYFLSKKKPIILAPLVAYLFAFAACLGQFLLEVIKNAGYNLFTDILLIAENIFSDPNLFHLNIVTLPFILVYYAILYF